MRLKQNLLLNVINTVHAARAFDTSHTDVPQKGMK